MLTPEQRDARRKYLCSSDMSAVLGLCPFKTPYGIWCDKTMPLLPDRETRNKQFGNVVEPLLLDWAQEDIGEPFERHKMMVADDGIFAANFDGVSPQDAANPFIVEAKANGVVSKSPYVWGRAGVVAAKRMLSPECPVPEAVVVQVHVAMYVRKCKRAYVVALRPDGAGYGMYTMTRSDLLMNLIVKAGHKFWADFVVTGIPPEKTEKDTKAAVAAEKE
jgi:predicted phage-related endonuclease